MAGATDETDRSSGPSLPPIAAAAADRAPEDYADLAGWQDLDPRPALAALRRQCEADAAPAAASSALRALCPHLPPPAADVADARAFVEAFFRPRPAAPDGTGFLTAYFEPEVAASPVPAGDFATPLLARPADLSEATAADREAGFPPHLSHGRRLSDGTLVPHPDRAAIAAGALSGQDLAIAWLKDPVDLFFIHVQGSARLVMPDGSVRRVGYAGKSGHPYTPIGRVLVERGALAREAVTKDAIEAWLRARPQDAPGVMNANESYIFFKERAAADPDLGPVAAAGAALTPLASLAVDPEHIPYGTLVHIAGDLPLRDPDRTAPFTTLAVAQDRGSAIVGPARADLFVGSGDRAGLAAGRIKHRVAMHRLEVRPQVRKRLGLPPAPEDE